MVLERGREMRKNKLPPGWYHKDGESNFIRYYNGRKWQDQTLPVPPMPLTPMPLMGSDNSDNKLEDNLEGNQVIETYQRNDKKELQLELPLENKIEEKTLDSTPIDSSKNIVKSPEVGNAFALALLPVGGEHRTRIKVIAGFISSIIIGVLLTVYSIENETSLFVNTPSIETITLANSLLTEVKYIATNNGRDKIYYQDFIGMDMNLSTPGLDTVDSKNGPWRFTGEDGTYLLITQSGSLDVGDL